jgi:hypothetical protein
LTVELRDVQGRLVRKQQHQANTAGPLALPISTSELPAGTYLVLASTSTGVQATRLVKAP